MRSLFFKIFALFWIAESLIFVISTTLIVRQRFVSPNILSDALDTNLRHTADAAMRAYAAGGCAAFVASSDRYEPRGAALLDAQGGTLCATAGAPSLAGLSLRFADRIDGRQLNGQYLWVVPVESQSGAQAEYVWFAPPPSPRHRPPHHWPLLRFAFPQLPVAIGVGGVTTFLLVLLISRPLVRMRTAARQLANGELDVRVEQTAAQAARSNSDEFQGLVHDFNYMAGRLESMVGAQKLLLRDVSHELRSPLARLSVALELAREDAEPGLDRHLARIERETYRLNQLIGQLLTLSSLETRDRRASFTEVSLNTLCEELLPDAEFEAQQRPCGIELIEETPLAIQGNAELLYRAIENVVRNAIRYTAAGTVVTLRLGAELIEGSRLAAIEVSDRGPGIPEAELTEIFRPFYRVDRARSADTGGFGVGLAITERAVRLHGGTVQALNRSDGGMTVRMLFPVG
jgi:two-component system sensor histidine kinase CpxA